MTRCDIHGQRSFGVFREFLHTCCLSEDDGQLQFGVPLGKRVLTYIKTSGTRPMRPRMQCSKVNIIKKGPLPPCGSTIPERLLFQ